MSQNAEKPEALPPEHAPVFISLKGKVSGPYTPAQIDALKASGEFFNFDWIWAGDKKSWEAITPPTPTPSAPVHAAEPARVVHLKSVTSPVKFPEGGTFHVICHDFHQLVPGVVAELISNGCIFTSSSKQSSPMLQQNKKIWLNFVNESTGYAVNVPGKLSQVTRKNGAWQYQVEWENIAQF